MRYRYESRNQLYEVNLERSGQVYQANVDGQTYEFEIMQDQPGSLTLRFEGRPVTLYWATDGTHRWISYEGCTHRLDKPSNRRPGVESLAGQQKYIRAPMPSLVRKANVQEGDRVKKGQTMLLLEAMKMEIHIQAPYDCKVASLKVKENDTVERDQLLIEIESDQQEN